uniref:Hypotheticial protein n=1 Tax=Schistosoma japonicum TaxID=6182 RepID=C1LDT5_SCHJA|nr:hypotheticial protein [Schistosoma japonicum]
MMVKLEVFLALLCLILVGTIQSHSHNDDDILPEDLTTLYEPLTTKKNIYNRVNHRKFNRQILKRGPETLWELD